MLRYHAVVKITQDSDSTSESKSKSEIARSSKDSCESEDDILKEKKVRGRVRAYVKKDVCAI